MVFNELEEHEDNMKIWIDGNKNHKDKMKKFFRNAKKLLKEHY